jgi:hypothetical protein
MYELRNVWKSVKVKSKNEIMNEWKYVDRYEENESRKKVKLYKYKGR